MFCCEIYARVIFVSISVSIKYLHDFGVEATSVRSVELHLMPSVTLRSSMFLLNIYSKKENQIFGG